MLSFVAILSRERFSKILFFYKISNLWHSIYKDTPAPLHPLVSLSCTYTPLLLLLSCENSNNELSLCVLIILHRKELDPLVIAGLHKWTEIVIFIYFLGVSGFYEASHWFLTLFPLPPRPFQMNKLHRLSMRSAQPSPVTYLWITGGPGSREDLFTEPHRDWELREGLDDGK